MGLRENNSQAWSPIQQWLLPLRRRGISVLIVHHAAPRLDEETAGQGTGWRSRRAGANAVGLLRLPMTRSRHLASIQRCSSEAGFDPYKVLV